MSKSGEKGPQGIGNCMVITEKVVCSLEDTLVDKGRTDSPAVDLSKPETWMKSMRQAEKEIALFMSRMGNPETIKAKPGKVDLRVNLVRGNCGAPIRSSRRIKR